MRRENKTQKGPQAKQQRKGFSLVELVVVIIIIAILAVAIFAGGSIAIKKAQISRAKSDLHNFDVAIQSYMFSDRKPVGLSGSSTDAEYLTVVNGLNKNLPKDYALKATGLSADGKISTALDHKYVYDSDKKDPWGNPYYFLVDPKERNSGETEYFFTVLTAGPNAKATVGGAVDKDDIFLLCQYSNSAVVSQTYSMSSDKKDATGTPLTVGTTILFSADGTTAPRNIGAARGGGAGATEPDTPGAPTSPAYLTFSSPNSFKISMSNSEKSWNGTLQYSNNKTDWTDWDGTDTITSSPDGKLYMRGIGNDYISLSLDTPGMDQFPHYYMYYWNSFYIDGTNVRCDGNIETLLDYQKVENGQTFTLVPYCFSGLFNSCTALISAPELPTKSLAEFCYSSMFQYCENLTAAPALPATALAEDCYSSMFDGCTSLTAAPALPATTLADSCYYSMFYGCASITTAPALPATTVAQYCYAGMFYDCTSLTAIPELPATILADWCYQNMFYGCTSIKVSETPTGTYTKAYRVPSTGTGTDATNALNNMFLNTEGTFTSGTPTIDTTYYLDASLNSIVHVDGTIS